MLKPDALAQLRDIHLPTPISWWPLALGWYALLAILLSVSIGLIYLSHKRRLHAQAKNQALKLLDIYKANHEKEPNTQLMSARISELLRRVALVYYPRSDVASLNGKDWIVFLNKTGKGIDFNPVASMLLESPFKPSPKGKESLNLKPLMSRAEQWIKQRGVPCSN